MDTKGWIVVGLCALGMVLYYPRMIRDMERSRPAPMAPGDSAGSKSVEGGVAKGREGERVPPGSTPGAPAGRGEPAAKAESVVLESGAVKFHLTNLGAGISKAGLLKHTAIQDGDGLIELNRFGSHPIGSLGEGVDQVDSEAYRIVSRSQGEVVFERVNADGLRIRKRFHLNDASENDGYVINLDLSLKNEDSRPYRQGDLSVFTGSVAPLHPKEWPQQTGFFWRNADKMVFRDVNYFKEKKVAGIGRGSRENIRESEEVLKWAGVMDQFYTIMVSSADTTAGSIWARRIPVSLDNEETGGGRKLAATEGGFGLPEVRLAPGEEKSFFLQFYTGPKEFGRLSDMGDDRHEIMNYGNFPVLGLVVAPVSRLLVKALVFLHGKVGNYGIAIVMITIMIRCLIWPLHAKSTKTMKRMAALSPMMKEMKEKYKDDPQKLNKEMMTLYKDYGVNPFGGCLPVFLQLPIFLGFYRMLQSAVELRHESFLWVDDLSMPDTLFEIPIYGGLPFNALPLLMGITMMLQMKVAPKSGDKMQQRIFMFMPLIFLFICYNFASALALYWTTQNIFSIGQTWYMSRRPEPVLEKVKASARRGSFSEMMKKAQDRTKTSEKGPKDTQSKAKQKKKRRK